MKMRAYLFFLLLFLTKAAFSQTQASDVIITKKGEQINCTVTRSDTARIYFKVGGNMSSIEVNLPLSEVQEVQYAPKKMPSLSQPTTQIQRDDYVETNTATVNPTTKKLEPPYKANCLSFFGGLASPKGDFNKSDTGKIGPAMLGSVAQLSFSHRTKKGVIAGLTCFYSINQLNPNPVAEKYYLLTDSVWTVDRAVWRAFGIHLSFGYHKIFSEDVSLYAKLNLGYVSLKYPEVTVTLNSSNYFKYNTANADAISYGGTIGVNYRLFESLGAALELSYVHANAKFNEVLVQGEIPASSGQPTKKISKTLRDVKQTYQNIFISLGANYWF